MSPCFCQKNQAGYFFSAKLKAWDLNEQAKRNIERLPKDFSFQLKKDRMVRSFSFYNKGTSFVFISLQFTGTNASASREYGYHSLNKNRISSSFIKHILRTPPLLHPISYPLPMPWGITNYFRGVHAGEGFLQTLLIQACLHGRWCRQLRARCNCLLVPLCVA